MTRKLHTSAIAPCKLKTSLCLFVAAFVLLANGSGPSPVRAADITLTKIGSPIWRPTDFQMFSAPTAPFPDAFFDTIDALLPLEGPGAATYTPHQPPYDTELSTNAAAAGFV
ncbi:MAG TPA: hypothetical protein VHK01_04215, partial [Lacipirellulaceae bacterium]|nr:hypothetical protein [Lacipirellulaceae bacterium]